MDVPPQQPVAPLVSSDEQDDTHLNVLKILWYVMAGVTLLGVCVGAVYLGFS